MNSELFDIIQVPVGYVLRFFNSIMGNQYIIALLVFAVIIEIVLIPFAIKQQKNSIKQASLRPKEMAIRKKYAGRDDQPTKQKMQEEIQALYQKEGFNPMGGCLPMLIQFPVLIMLYNVVVNPLKYICGLSNDAIYQALEIVTVAKNLDVKTVEKLEGLLKSGHTIKLASYIEEIGIDAFSSISGFEEAITAHPLPDFNYFGINFGDNPPFFDNVPAAGEGLQYILLAVPVITFLVYFFSSKLTRKLSYQPTTADDPQVGCSNKIMDIIMPLFSVYITFITPAVVGIYWIFKSILGVLKQFIMKKAMPIPTFTEEEYKEAEKELNARTEKTSKVNKSGRVVRSLHHIDDEDFEDTREAALKHKAALEAQEAADAEAKAANAPKLSSLFGGAAVKKDDKKDEKKSDGASEDAKEVKTEEKTDKDNK